MNVDKRKLFTDSHPDQCVLLGTEYIFCSGLLPSKFVQGSVEFITVHRPLPLRPLELWLNTEQRVRGHRLPEDQKCWWHKHSNDRKFRWRLDPSSRALILFSFPVFQRQESLYFNNKNLIERKLTMLGKTFSIKTVKTVIRGTKILPYLRMK